MFKLLLALTLASALISCTIESPTVNVTKLRTASFDHTGIEDGCSDCHDGEQPADAIHKDQLSCQDCHTTDTWKNNENWEHPIDSTTCNSCHEADRPADALMNMPNPNAPTDLPGSYDNSHYTAKDCADCHLVPQKTTKPWVYQHTDYSEANAKYCLPCHFEEGWEVHSKRPRWFKGDGMCARCHKEKKSWD